MLPNDKQQTQALLQENGALTIAELMGQFGISMETARRDLAAMEKAGLVTRVHGGALLPEYTVMLTGGTQNPKERTLTGDAVATFFSGVYVQKAFIFPAVLSLKAGITNYTKEFKQWVGPMLHNCARLYVLADSSKFEHTVAYQLTPTRQDYIYITDKELPETLRQMYAENHLKFIDAEE